jgi:hypothetical protein
VEEVSHASAAGSVFSTANDLVTWMQALVGGRVFDAQCTGSILYRSGMNKKIGRNFEVFTPCDFTAAITQHIPDKGFQLVRYYGWYSNKMRRRRAKQADEGVQPRATSWR